METPNIKQQLEEVIKKNENEAINYAIQIIESYQMDIRQAGYDKDGFCQGVIYKDAIKDIKKRISPSLIADEVLKVVVETCCKDCKKMIELSNEKTQ